MVLPVVFQCISLGVLPCEVNGIHILMRGTADRRCSRLVQSYSIFSAYGVSWTNLEAAIVEEPSPDIERAKNDPRGRQSSTCADDFLRSFLMRGGLNVYQSKFRCTS